MITFFNSDALVGECTLSGALPMNWNLLYNFPNEGDISVEFGEINSVSGGDFSDPSIWAGGVVPGPNTPAIINGGHTVTIDVPMIDVGVIRQIKNGNVHIVPGINCFHGKTVEFVDGTSQPFDSVVFGTGYTPSVNDFLNVPLTSNTEGVPVDSGCEIIPGLYFCGFYISPRGMLHEIGIEAKKIAASIAGD